MPMYSIPTNTLAPHPQHGWYDRKYHYTFCKVMAIWCSYYQYKVKTYRSSPWILSVRHLISAGGLGGLTFVAFLFRGLQKNVSIIFVILFSRIYCLFTTCTTFIYLNMRASFGTPAYINQRLFSYKKNFFFINV